MPTLTAITADLALPAGSAVLVGLSGGLDSTVLLHLLAADPVIRATGLRAIHVHHGLHADADHWQAECMRQCAGLGVALAVVRTDVAAGSGLGLEGAARAARHAAFAAHLREGEVLALAHHRDDQAETFLLRALRGSGPDGLGAMRSWRRFASGWLWRPLLHVPRAELLAHARQHGLHWIEDPSNADTALDRNFLRHRVLPLLRERWPHADAMFARSAALAAEAVELLDAQDAAGLASARCGDPDALEVEALRALPAARRARVLRRWIGELGLPPLPAAGIARIESCLLQAAGDGQAEFAWSDAVIRRWRGLLHAGVQRPPLPAAWQAVWDGHSPLPLPDGGLLALEGAAGFDTPVRVHARQGGERIVLPGRAQSHALKHVLQDLGVPPWERARLPLLSAADDKVLAAGDLAYSGPFDAWLRTHAARLTWTD